MCVYLLKYLLVSVEIDHILNLRYDLMIGFSPNKEKDYYTSNEKQQLFHLSNYFYFLIYCIPLEIFELCSKVMLIHLLLSSKNRNLAEWTNFFL